MYSQSWHADLLDLLVDAFCAVDIYCRSHVRRYLRFLQSGVCLCLCYQRHIPITLLWWRPDERVRLHLHHAIGYVPDYLTGFASGSRQTMLRHCFDDLWSDHHHGYRWYGILPLSRRLLSLAFDPQSIDIRLGTPR